MPEKHRTAEFCLAAVNSFGKALKHVPENHKTAELCRVAVDNYSHALEYVPEKHKTYELCLAAMNNGDDLEFVPENHKTAELCLAAMEVFKSESDRFYDQKLRSLENYLDKKLFPYVPEAILDKRKKAATFCGECGAKLGE
jgi:hypothetical protein